MRAYNETAAPGQDLHFYGVDTQSYEYSFGYLLEEAQRLGIDVSKYRNFEDGENRLALCDEAREQLGALDKSAETDLALHLVDVLVQNDELGKLIDSPLRACIDEPVMMGSVGDGFSPLMYVLPQTYRVKREPASPYDSMIFVAHAHPTEYKTLAERN